MSIVIFRDNIMAADRMVCQNNVNIGSMKKIHKLPDGSLLGWTGQSGDAFKMLKWLTKNEPGIYNDDGCYGGAILVKKDKRLWIYDNTRSWQPVESEWLVTGSLTEFAQGCLASGKSAIQTVSLCQKYGNFIGNGVDVFDIRDSEPDVPLTKKSNNLFRNLFTRKE